jgi:membrane protease YdiL (CAAX protease family)
MNGVLTWTPGPPREVGHWRRMLEVLGIWALWVAIGEAMTGTGWELPGDAHYVSNADIWWYLVIGIPLVAVFQLWVRRRPLRDLWVRDGQPLGRRLSSRMAVLALLLSIYPLYSLVKTIVDAPEGEVAGIFYYGSIAAIGAGAAAWAFLHFDRQTWRYLLLCLGTAGVIGVIVSVVSDWPVLTHPTANRPGQDVVWGLESFLLYLPTVMVMEEVAFRGAFDSHAYHDGDRHGIWTAIYVSVLWALWHGPLIGWDQFVGAILFMGSMGTFLSIFWRRSGNLEVSGTVHAFSDAVRNATGGTP